MPITIDGTNGITQAGEFNSDSSFGFKNRLINGQMTFDQRNAGASITANDGTYPVDRFRFTMSASSKGTGQQQTSVVPNGFRNSLKFTSSAATSLGSTDFYCLEQYIEGYNLSDLGLGTANPKTFTISAQVYSSLTGTFGGSVQNADSTRSYPFTYTISSANTWTTISVTITGDTTGTWNTTNGIGMKVCFGLGVGTTYSGTAGAWAGTWYASATGATSVVGTNGATFYITGVQLEVGSTATSFDYRQYGTELQLCQRYLTVIPATSYIPAYITSTTTGYCIYNPPVALRTAPTGISTSVSGNLYNGTSAVSLTNLTFTGGTTASLVMTGTVASGLTLGYGSMLYTSNAIQLTGCEL
jgi:hypothetical protein